LVIHNIDTTEGNSGSPIYVVDEEWVNNCRSKTKNSKDKPELTKVVVGVHTGAERGKAVNYGTLITFEIDTWIKTEVAKFAKD